MRCRTCGSVMVVDHCESGTGATTCWHSCSLCHTVRLTSAPDTGFPDGGPAEDGSAPGGEPDDLSAMVPRGEDDGGYAGDPPANGLDLET